MSDVSLEERAKILLRYRITREGEVPNILLQKWQEALQYLFENNYLTRNYNLTSEGEKWLENSSK